MINDDETVSCAVCGASTPRARRCTCGHSFCDAHWYDHLTHNRAYLDTWAAREIARLEKAQANTQEAGRR